MADQQAITATDVTRVYRKGRHEIRAVDGVSLDFAKGEFAALYGTSGAGKSTLLYLLGGLGRPTSGTVRVDGQDLADLDESALAQLHRDHVAFVFQFFHLLPTLTALENVLIPMVPTGVPAPERVERAMAAIEQVGLPERCHHLPGELSGGEQQRVVLARALVMEPQILLADEPTSDLDRRSAEAVFDLLRQLNEQGRTVVMATHDMRILERAPRRIEMEDGRIVQEHVEAQPAG